MDGIVDDDTSWEPSAKLRYDATENDDDDDDDDERSWFSSSSKEIPSLLRGILAVSAMVNYTIIILDMNYDNKKSLF